MKRQETQVFGSRIWGSIDLEGHVSASQFQYDFGNPVIFRFPKSSLALSATGRLHAHRKAGVSTEQVRIFGR